MTKASFHVISHTHWDREWYLTFEQFRFRLVDLINNLLDLLDRDPGFEVFHLDGQTIVLEDYYAIHPENKDRLEAHIRAGRILIGPWYLQNDEYLTSGEATIRNLQTGIAMSRQIAGEMKVGYLPDQFGNIPQMPQILRGFGIGNVVFGRGYDISRHREQEFLWEGADGSRVTAIFLPNWYNNAQRFPADPDKAVKVLQFIRERIDPYRQTSCYLLMNGVDHLEAQENLSGILAELRKSLPEGEEILHTTLPEHIRRVEAELANPGVRKGEMRAGDDYHILAGTLSARVYLKQANVRAQDLLEKWIEPLALWSSISGLGDYPQAYLNYLWKELMKNHPHDSICGCSQDEVHEHMMDRFASVEEAGGEVYRRAALQLARQIDTAGMDGGDQLLAVFNPGTIAQSSWLEAPVDFQESEGVERFSLLDASGKAVPYRIVRKEKTRKQRLSPINLPTELPVDRYTVQWLAANVPAQGYTSYRIVPHGDGAVIGGAAGASSAAGLPVLENDRLRVEIQPNGALTLTDRRTGRSYPDALTFVDDADAGDLYVFKYLEGAESLLSADWAAKAVMTLDTSEVQQAEITWRAQLPAGLDESGLRRSGTLADYPLKAVITLARGTAALDVRIELENNASDHRLRVRFPVPGGADASMAGGQFDVTVRDKGEGTAYSRNANSQPNWKWAAAGTSEGIAVFNRGLHEYELMNDGASLDLTLIRSVGTIFGRPNPLPHENDDNPLGQCPGFHAFELAIRPFGDGEGAPELAQEAEAWHHGLRAVVVPVSEDKWAQGRPWVQDSEISELFSRPDPNAGKPRLPREASFLALEGGVVLSSVKRQLGGSLTAVRFYNPSDAPAQAALSCRRPISRAWKGDLMEQPADELAVADGRIVLTAGPKEIVTLLLEHE